MKAHELAQKAADILKQRGLDNGYDAGEERSAATIAKVYNLITGHELTEADAWMFLIVLKLVREGRKHQLDNLLDMSNYALLLAESNQLALCDDGGCPHHGTPHVCVAPSPKPTDDPQPFNGGLPLGWFPHKPAVVVGKLKCTSTDGDETVGGKGPEGGKTVTVQIGGDTSLVAGDRLAQAIKAEISKACQPSGQLFRQIATYNHPAVK